MKEEAVSKREPTIFLYISPWLLGTIFTLYPMVYSLILVFTDTDLTGSGKFIGFDNIVRSFTKDDLF